MVWGLTFGCILAFVAILILLFTWAHKHDGLVCGIRICPKQRPRCVAKSARRFSYHSDLESSVTVNFGTQSPPSEVWSLQSQSHLNTYDGCPGVFQASSSTHVEHSQQSSPILDKYGPQDPFNREKHAAEAASRRQSLVESINLHSEATLPPVGQASGDEAQEVTIRSPFVPYPQCYTPIPNPWADEAGSPLPTTHHPVRASVAKVEDKAIPLQNLPRLPDPTKFTRQLGRVPSRLNSGRLSPRPYYNHEEDEMWAEAYALSRDDARITREPMLRSISKKSDNLGSKGSDITATSGSCTRPLRKPKGPRGRSLTPGEQRRAAKKGEADWKGRTSSSQKE